MTIIELIIIGYIVNVLVVAILIFITILNTLFNMFNPEYMAQFLELQKEINKNDNLKLDLKAKGIQPYIQADFSFFIPYAELIMFFKFITALFGNGILFFLYSEIRKKGEILESKLNK